MNNIRMIGCLLIVLTLAGATSARADDVLSALRKGHPRLIVLDEDLPRIKQAIEKYPRAAQYYHQFETDAPKIIAQPVVKHVLIGPRLLDQSRAALHRITALAALYRLDGEKQYAERARDEMLAAAAFA